MRVTVFVLKYKSVEGGQEMRIALIVLAGIGAVIITVLYGICKFILLVAGRILGVLSVLVAIVGLAILILVDPLGGIIWLVIAFVISPFGLPLLAVFLVGWLGGVSQNLMILPHGSP
jgi:hypothetical protein